jgi:histidinol phosphatase-like PHP family hydrolase
MLLPFDSHVHSYYSPCAHGVDRASQPVASPERYLQRAGEIGLRTLVFTDHLVEDPTLPGVVLFYKGSGVTILRNLRLELDRLPAMQGCDVFIGCETETLSTEWVGVSEALARELDLVLVPTTHYHLPGVPQPASAAPRDVATHLLVMLEAVVRKPWLDAVAHPFAESESLIGDLRAIYEAMDKARLRDVLGLAARNRVALEVNASSLAAPSLPNYATVYREIVTLAKSLGVRFTFGSDAHNYANLGMTPEAEAWITASGLTSGDFLSPQMLRAKRG